MLVILYLEFNAIVILYLQFNASHTILTVILYLEFNAIVILYFSSMLVILYWRTHDVASYKMQGTVTDPNNY